MSEEKKNLTDEERKELNGNLKNQIHEMSDKELDNVAGGATLIDPRTTPIKSYKHLGYIRAYVTYGICDIEEFRYIPNSRS